MDLLNTLIVDPTDPQHLKKFTDFIEDDRIINFIVLGDDANAKTLVQKADLLADDHTGKIERKVAWIKDHQTLKDQTLKYLKSFPGYDATKYDQTLGYTLSPKFHECKYVFLNGDPIGDINVSKAYWKASLRERNEA